MLNSIRPGGNNPVTSPVGTVLEHYFPRQGDVGCLHGDYTASSEVPHTDRVAYIRQVAQAPFFAFLANSGYYSYVLFDTIVQAQ